MDSGEWVPRAAPVVVPRTGPGFEYARVPWDEVNDYGANGWRLTSVPPMQEVKVTLGQPTPGEVVFVMERVLPEGERF